MGGLPFPILPYRMRVAPISESKASAIGRSFFAKYRRPPFWDFGGRKSEGNRAKLGATPASLVQIPGAASTRNAISPNVADENSDRKTKYQDRRDRLIEHGAHPLVACAPKAERRVLGRRWKARGNYVASEILGRAGGLRATAPKRTASDEFRKQRRGLTLTVALCSATSPVSDYSL
jgi:hypothetical protein